MRQTFLLPQVFLVSRLNAPRVPEAFGSVLLWVFLGGHTSCDQKASLSPEQYWEVWACFSSSNVLCFGLQDVGSCPRFAEATIAAAVSFVCTQHCARSQQYY